MSVSVAVVPCIGPFTCIVILYMKAWTCWTLTSTSARATPDCVPLQMDQPPIAASTIAAATAILTIELFIISLLMRRPVVACSADLSRSFCS